MSRPKLLQGIQSGVNATVVRATAGLTSLFQKRSWPALAEPENSVESLNTAVIGIKERMLVQSRERGGVLSSFVTVQDLINIGLLTASGRLLEQRVSDIEKRLDDAGIP